MSDTPITPTVGATTLAGVASSLLFGTPRAPVGAGLGLAGVVPTLTAVGALTSREGRPLSWSGLGANATGSAIGPIPYQQVRLTAGGVFGAAGALLEGSTDNSTWATLATLPPGVTVVVSANDAIATPDYLYLRPRVQGGDGSTAIAVTGNISTTGCV